MASAPSGPYARLRERYLADRGSDDRNPHAMAIARLEGALDAIGWRSANGASSQEVAAEAVHVIADCVNGHHDVGRASQSLAELLHRSAATLDGSMYAASAYVPAAEEVLGRYAGGRA